MNKIDINKYNIVHGVPPKLTKTDRVAIDTEFTSMDKKRLHRPTGHFACATFYFGTDEVYIVDNVRDLPLAMSNIEDAGWIFHNAKFDIFHLRRFVPIHYRTKMWDTMLVEQVRFSGLYDEFSLAALFRRYCDGYMEKDTRDEFSDLLGEMTQGQVDYACIDVIATHAVFVEQRQQISDTDLNIWKSIELPFLWCLLSVGGVKLDTDRWLAIAKENGDKANAIQAKYGKEVQKISEKTGKPLKATTFNGINLASPKQVKEALQVFGISVESTGESELESFLSRPATYIQSYPESNHLFRRWMELSQVIDFSTTSYVEFIKDLLEYRTLSKRAGTYGSDYVEKYVEDDGRIYTDYFQMGAISGRLSSRAPNLQNQPREGGYRDCYVAQDGYELVIADSTAQEPKFAAFICKDDNLIDALNSNEKLYIRIARDALGIEVKKGEELYNHMKSTILGLFYGMSAEGLAERIGKTVNEAQEMINAIFLAYPNLAAWIHDSQSSFRPYALTVSGRKVWLNEYTSSWRRLVLNAPIQGSAAEAFKLGVVNTVKNWHGSLDVQKSVLRLFVHDEEVCEVPAEDVERFIPVLTKSMIDAAESLHVGIKAGVEVGHGHAWSAKV